MTADDPARPTEPEAQLLEELRFSASLSLDALRSAEPIAEEQLAAAAHLVASADRTLHRLVASAREQGTSWARIGSTLGISRQAAQKRFSDPPQRVVRDAAEPDPALVDRAVRVMGHAAVGEAAAIDALLGPRMQEVLGDAGIAPVLAGVDPVFGRLLSRSDVRARVIAQVTVVSALEHRARTDAAVRVSLLADGRLLGITYDLTEATR